MNPLQAGLRQPDARSCGAATVVMARLLHDGATRTPQEFRDDVLACHRRLTATRDAGRWQLPWPRAIGTPPWAVARELERITGREHTLHLARWSPTTAYDRLAAHGGALYVGSRTLPRHVLLVLAGSGAAGEALTCYQPSRGTVVTLARDDFEQGRPTSAGWPHPWFAISPAGPVVPGVHPPAPR